MSRSRPDARVYRAVALLGAMILTGCHGVSRVGGDYRNHPIELVGEWVDRDKTTSADTALWVLGPDGEDASVHRRLVAQAGTTSEYLTTDRRHYGYWFVRGDMRSAADHALCFTNRPGRSAPQCSSFVLDTLRVDGLARRRLRVQGYTGAHHVADRVLLARTP